ncbi:hypothetical protein EDC01DRAFT_728378 [Geopyxis carbonaria]|nr:hypothetical protein EDC01DRAFT_728378 [Geopyxis carbonaria]
MQIFIFSVVFSILFLLVQASPRPQVFDWISPNTAPPPGCVQDFDGRFTVYITPEVPSGPEYMYDDERQVAMTLENGIMLDRWGRIGCIVANRQFQFDGPPAQAGAIYTAGWAYCPDEKILTLGGQKLFWACNSGGFANLYDQTLGSHCWEGYLEVSKLID